jgi:hypothetical protein
MIFQGRVRMENIDSRIRSFGFCYCRLQRVDGSLADFCNTIGTSQTQLRLKSPSDCAHKAEMPTR